MNKTTASRSRHTYMYLMSRISARPNPFPGTVSRPNAGATHSAVLNLHTMHSLANVARSPFSMCECVCRREERAHCLCSRCVRGRHSFAIFSMQMSASENREHAMHRAGTAQIYVYSVYVVAACDV
jgi:hypothetical protein